MGGTMESSGRVGFYISSYQKDAIDLDITGGSIVSNGGSALQIYSGANVTVSGNASISAPSSTAIQVQGGVTGSESTLTVNGRYHYRKRIWRHCGRRGKANHERRLDYREDRLGSMRL